MGECFSALLCLFLGSSIATPSRERSCTMTNRMRESRSCGSVRAEGSNVLGYSEVSVSKIRYPRYLSDAVTSESKPRSRTSKLGTVLVRCMRC